MKVTIIKPNKIWSEKTINEIADRYTNAIVGERKYDSGSVYHVDLEAVYKGSSSFEEFLVKIEAKDDLGIQESSFIQDYKYLFDLLGAF